MAYISSRKCKSNNNIPSFLQILIYCPTQNNTHIALTTILILPSQTKNNKLFYVKYFQLYFI